MSLVSKILISVVLFLFSNLLVIHTILNSPCIILIVLSMLNYVIGLLIFVWVWST